MAVSVWYVRPHKDITVGRQREGEGRREREGEGETEMGGGRFHGSDILEYIYKVRTGLPFPPHTPPPPPPSPKEKIQWGEQESILECRLVHSEALT